MMLIIMNQPPAKSLKQHARLAEIYGKPDPNLSEAHLARRQRLV